MRLRSRSFLLRAVFFRFEPAGGGLFSGNSAKFLSGKKVSRQKSTGVCVSFCFFRSVFSAAPCAPPRRPARGSFFPSFYLSASRHRDKSREIPAAKMHSPARTYQLLPRECNYCYCRATQLRGKQIRGGFLIFPFFVDTFTRRREEGRCGGLRVLGS